MKKTILSFALLICALVLLADESDESIRRLSERVAQVVFAEPLVPVGKTSEQQFLSVLEQVSDRYEVRWKVPLSVAMDLTAIRHLRNHPDILPQSTGAYTKDVPLMEMLRGWCVRAELEMFIVEERIVIVARRK